jgi:hypothetical protein
VVESKIRRKIIENLRVSTILTGERKRRMNEKLQSLTRRGITSLLMIE